MYVIWFSCVWVIWKEWNNRVFDQKKESIHRLLDKVKLLSYQWLKEKYVSLACDYHGWWLSSFSCLDNGRKPFLFFFSSSFRLILLLL